MSSMPPNSIHESDPRLERVFVEREQNRLAGRALLVLVILNGAASLVLLAVLARAPDASIEPKIAAAMLFFAGGAVGALLSSFLAYVNRAIRIEAPERTIAAARAADHRYPLGDRQRRRVPDRDEHGGRRGVGEVELASQRGQGEGGAGGEGAEGQCAGRLAGRCTGRLAQGGTGAPAEGCTGRLAERARAAST